MKIFPFVIFFLCAISVQAKLIDIGLFPQKSINSFTFSSQQGEYVIYSEKGKLKSISSENLAVVKQQNGKLILIVDGDLMGSFDKLNFIGSGVTNYFKLSGFQPSMGQVKFDDNLKLFFNNGKLQLVNNIDLENYIAGVVEAEVGRLAPKEYLKLQGIICRTYALGNMHKHYLDGYNLCSEVHCQAYNGKTLYKDILSAVYTTKDIVVVDSDISLITAVFHSSCGGQTVNSEDAWSTPVYYLRSVVDSFCIDGKNAEWEKTVDAQKWEQYLQKELSVNRISSQFYAQKVDGRKVYFMENNPLRMKKIREDWKLRSAFFTAEKSGDKVLLKGKGYGHGVGLCQIGAMEMARRNYTYAQILHHYYRGVHLVSLTALDFFRDKP